ncbi:MAG: RNase adapter RapZ [Clostridia bacterium]|nr:RNase adapter RapZ [Clostridia bacterium]
MEFLIVTGLSGAGKSKAVEMLEDIDFVCIDNLPPKLLPSLGAILRKSGGDAKTAVVVDVRSGMSFKTFSNSLSQLRENGVDYHILFIDCDDDVLLKRYNETRRRHPLAKKYNGSVEEAIRAERAVMDPVRQEADYVIDTTQMASRQLKERIAGLFVGDVRNTLRVQVLSFGFKYGIPQDANIVYDVRCLPNPFYLPELRLKSGMDPAVRDYLMSFPQSRELLQKLTDLVDFSLPLYLEEGKPEVVIAFGCTGGQHRSVAFAEAMYHHLQETGVSVHVIHRDQVKNKGEIKARGV